jgi:hypothetical protein
LTGLTGFTLCTSARAAPRKLAICGNFFDRRRRKTAVLKPAGISLAEVQPVETDTTERAALLNQLQSARLLGVSPASMRQMVAAGSLEPVRIAGLGRPRFRRSDVEALIREGRAP